MRWPNTWDVVDIVIHVVVAVVIVSLLGFFIAPLLAAVLNAVFWFVRELAQHRWSVKEMGGQSWAEFIAPAIAGGLTAILFLQVEAGLNALI